MPCISHHALPFCHLFESWQMTELYGDFASADDESEHELLDDSSALFFGYARPSIMQPLGFFGQEFLGKRVNPEHIQFALESGQFGIDLLLPGV